MLTVITVKIGRIELKSVSGLGSNLLSGAGNSAPPTLTHTHTHTMPIMDTLTLVFAQS